MACFCAARARSPKNFPEIFYGEHIIDNTCMQLVMNPYQYDTLLLENLYGDIVSDLCAAFVGGLGLVPGANLGAECAIFEAVHGSAPDIAGKDLANPTALLQSAVLMLHHLDEAAAADKVQKALETVYAERKMLTRDVGGALRHHPICRRRPCSDGNRLTRSRSQNNHSHMSRFCFVRAHSSGINHAIKSEIPAKTVRRWQFGR